MMAFVMRFQPDLLSNALTEGRLIDYLNLRQRKDQSSTIENGLSFPFQKFIGKVPRQHEIVIRLFICITRSANRPKRSNAEWSLASTCGLNQATPPPLFPA
jgi:hypothetical protein